MDLEIVTPRTVVSNSDLTYSNIGGIALRNYSIVIDTSIYGKTGALFRKELEKHFNLLPKYLIYTHYHGDHVFGGRPFKDLIPVSSGPGKPSCSIRDDISGHRCWGAAGCYGWELYLYGRGR